MVQFLSKNKFFRFVLFSYFLLFFSCCANASAIIGAGSTLAYPLYNAWANAYSKLADMKLNYQAIGSGAGIKLVKNGSVNFGASDVPLSKIELSKAHLIQWPMLIGGVALVYNLPGVEKLRLTPSILADIYLGKITKWNNKAIREVNPGVVLPDTPIVAVHRSDGSGTTFIFTQYLSRVSRAWKKNIGVNEAVNWPNGVGGKGSVGVTALVHQTQGSIGYVEYAYASSGIVRMAALKNRSGVFVKPSLVGFEKAAEHANFLPSHDFVVVLTDQEGRESWPIVGASYILMNPSLKDRGLVHSILKFFSWSLERGKKEARILHYVSVPQHCIPVIYRYWHDKIRVSRDLDFSEIHANR